MNQRFVRGKERLQRIGPVLHVSSSRNIILKAENVPRIGAKVVNENFKPVGITLDVFGPTSAPYVAVKPSIKALHTLVDHVLYTVSKPRRKERKKK